jgi:leucine dehydrogenase
VLVSDVVDERAAAVAASTGATVVPPDDAIGVECDVYAPCALGATLSRDTIPRLKCRVVGGSANNQLAEPEDAHRLREAGILYAPDFVINVGGVLYAWGVETLAWTPEEVEARLAGIGDALGEVFTRAEAEGVTTEEAAERIARARLG